MDTEQVRRMARNFHGSAWPWVKTRPASHWIWRLALSLGEEHIMCLPDIIREMSGWRGFPSRRTLKFYELREELIEHWELYRGEPVRGIVKDLEAKTGLRVTGKYIYNLIKKYEMKRGNGNV